MCLGVRVGMQREHTFLFREKKVNFSQSETGYFKIGKEKVMDKLNKKLGRERKKRSSLVWSGWLKLNKLIRKIMKFSFKVRTVHM